MDMSIFNLPWKQSNNVKFNDNKLILQIYKKHVIWEYEKQATAEPSSTTHH